MAAMTLHKHNKKQTPLKIRKIKRNQRSSGRYSADLDLSVRCREGDETAFRCLTARLGNKLRAILVRRGANPTTADDLIEDLWGDCFAVEPGKTSLFVKYHGKSSLDTWLVTVLTHRWVDQLRKNRKLEALDGAGRRDWPAVPESPLVDPGLAGLVRDAVRYAFGRCDPVTFVMLQLVHVHGVSQRVIARRVGVSEFKMSRALSQAMRRICQDTVATLREREPLLHLEWEDLLDICLATDVLGSVESAKTRKTGLLEVSPPQVSGHRIGLETPANQR